ncbi:hypothetical protein [Aurantiacibacter spongiae]|uniref:Uncharacterized protein n=1 Tax=Aurantiacibacter spongiae TaxID=2488860 RepID=A0A3N5DM83_9SPHN|nr:hypothetical protein [Aurantiacibacter spongiae]RPF71955.1 hypothetical protein EG799_10265 [Aurantiacibacter spongiae]
MGRYRVISIPGNRIDTKAWELEAPSINAALIVADINLDHDRHDGAEILEGDRRVASIRRSLVGKAGLWEVC